MKKIFALALVLAPLSVFAQKFGYFNSEDVIQTMPEFTQAQTELQTLQKQYEEELNYLQEEYQKKAQDYQEKMETLPDNIKQRREEELYELQDKMTQYYNDCQMQLQRASNEKMQAITQKVLKAAQEVGNEEGFVFILDSANGAGIPFISTTLCVDVIEKIQKKLNVK